MNIRVRETNLGPVTTGKAVAFIVYDSWGNPIIYVDELTPETIMIHDAGDDNFQENIKSSGLCTEEAPSCKKLSDS